METSYAKRLAIASVFGFGATFVVFLIAAALNGAFFGKDDSIAVTRCYFTTPSAEATADTPPGQETRVLGCLPSQPEENGMVAFFNRFMRTQTESPALPPGRYDRNSSAKPQ